MNLTYKILWFEDEFISMKPLVKDIKSFVEGLGFKFIDPKVESDNTNIESINYSDYDLILMDYKLSEEKGDVIINRIRSHNIYTEIVFYSSSSVQDLRKAVQEKELDGVYCVDRAGESFLPKVQEVIKSTVKKVLDLNNMRGIVMAKVSDFDEKMIEIIKAYLLQLNETESTKFTAERKKKVVASLVSKMKKVETYSSDELYRSQSFEAYQKWMAVFGIVKEKYKSLEECTNLYKTEIIDKRNLLGHVTETTDKNGIKQLSYGGFVFNDETCLQILNDLKKHEENFNAILSQIQSGMT